MLCNHNFKTFILSFLSFFSIYIFFAAFIVIAQKCVHYRTVRQTKLVTLSRMSLNCLFEAVGKTGSSRLQHLAWHHHMAFSHSLFFH